MLFDQAADSQMQVMRIAGGAAVMALIAAPMLRHHGQKIRLAAAAIYIGLLLGLIVYYMI
jgi:hypothetical protein